jgi:hypothetical protein
VTLRRHLGLVPLALLAAAPAQASVDVTAHPTLYPRFDRKVSDYVSRCSTDRPLRLDVRASGGDRVAVGDRAAKSGEFSARVRRRVGTAVEIRVKRKGAGTTHRVRCLPRDFPRWRVRRRGTPKAQWYLVTPIGGRTRGQVAIFDSDGVPVWWWHSSSYGPWDAKLLPNGRLAWTRYLGDRFGTRDAEAYEERELDGTLRRSIRVVGAPTDTHELQQLPNGNYLVEAYKPRDGVDLRPYGPADARVYDALIQELTPSGKVVWSWNSKDHIRLAETGRWWQFLNRQGSPESSDRRSWDLVHVNSIEPDADGLILSARHLDAVFRIDRATGAVDWKLGGTKRPESLRVIGDPHAHLPLAGQHDARLWGDGTLTVLDNRTGFDVPPRAVRYRIDTDARTARLLESIDVPDDLRSECCGSARKLRGSHWVVYWGAKPGPVTEQTPAGKLVFELDFGRRWGYRGIPVEPGVLSAKALRRAMERLSRSANAAAAR